MVRCRHRKEIGRDERTSYLAGDVITASRYFGSGEGPEREQNGANEDHLVARFVGYAYQILWSR
jgi:hypothetical protein